jgi:hypothetical protein
MKFNVGVPVGRTKVELTWDILNVLNLINNEYGVLEYANFNDLLVLSPSVNATTGVTTYNLSNLFASGVRRNPEDLFTRSDLLSRWQMQWGIRFRF